MLKYVKHFISTQVPSQPGPTVPVPEGRKQPNCPTYDQLCLDNIRRMSQPKDDPLARGDIPSLIEISLYAMCYMMMMFDMKTLLVSERRSAISVLSSKLLVVVRFVYQ